MYWMRRGIAFSARPRICLTACTNSRPRLLLATAPAAAHGWLTGLISPVGESCCDGSDCPPVDHRYDAATRELQVLIEGTWIAVDPATLVAMPTPDGGAHACYGRSWLRNQMTPVVRCVILPGEA